MGKSDDYQFDDLDDSSRLDDQANGALLKGRQVVKPEEPEQSHTERAVGMRKNHGHG